MNKKYQDLLKRILYTGTQLETRNHTVLRARVPEFTINNVPLITVRKTAWQKALREMQWFLQEAAVPCPPELANSWWKGQLSRDGYYFGGYGYQFRGRNDQLYQLLSGLRKHPNSRRNIITTWNAVDMYQIDVMNHNPRTPTTCHGTMLQFFVENGLLNMYHYQRSADMLLGLPHNLMQYWAFLLYLAYHTDLAPGTIEYKLGDSHIYYSDNHIAAAMDIVRAEVEDYDGQLVYDPPKKLPIDYGVPAFRAKDFSLTKQPAEPITTVKPELF
jgi:thymidylate synthase